ncbi:hypothetical protein BVG19_g3592 [[Candida] boidinii]|nr:hypothetical protein BVG19_g3592 [[Candida] boidinii]OWB49611.1 hypothetical protein B5S27_g1152 [[Candida] boidinii]
MKIISLLFFIITILSPCLSLSGSVQQQLTKSELKKLSLQSENYVIYSNDNIAESILNGPKDFNLVVLYTASDDKFACHMCKFFQPVFESVAKFWNINYPENDDTFFVIIDFPLNPKLFSKLKMTNVPHCWLYPKSMVIYKGLKYEDQDDKNSRIVYDYDYEGGDDEEFDEDDIDYVDYSDSRKKAPKLIDATSEHYTYVADERLMGKKDVDKMTFEFADFIGRILKKTITIHKPFDQTQFITYFVVCLLFFIILKKKKDKIESKLFKTSKPWCIACIILILISISGYNFVIQRQSPLFSADKQGNLVNIVPDPRRQLGFEVLISILLNVSLSLITIFLVSGIQLLNDISHKKRDLGMILFGIFLFVGFNIYSSTYKQKDGGYPFVFWDLKLF